MQSVLARLEGQLELERQQRKLPGMSTAVIYDQGIVWSHGFGLANVEEGTPATAQTLYGVGSITKLFTDTMLMQLRDAGKLQLDEPVQRYLPAFQVPSPYHNAPLPTFRQIASHTGGLPREAPGNYWRTRQFPTLDQLLVSLQNTEMIGVPGAVYNYSNLGVAVMGNALAAVAGEPYRQYVGDNILQPLGMENSGFELTDEVKARLANGYAFPSSSIGANRFPDAGAFTPAGGLYSSVEDMARFISLQFRDEPAGGDQVLSGSSLREMRQAASKGSNVGPFAIGWQLSSNSGYSTIGHPGVVFGFTTQIVLLPELKLGVAVFTNGRTDPESLSNEILAALIPAIKRALQP
ncbi:MAG: serine hydrolase domain-containing protein [Dehalococcoidia bacterium]